MKNGRPLAFYRKTLNAGQKSYTTRVTELLIIVEILKDFRNMLLWKRIVVHNDHKNILYSNLTKDRIIRWRYLLEEYGAQNVHIKQGVNNIVADNMSR